MNDPLNRHRLLVTVPFTKDSSSRELARYIAGILKERLKTAKVRVILSTERIVPGPPKEKGTPKRPRKIVPDGSGF